MKRNALRKRNRGRGIADRPISPSIGPHESGLTIPRANSANIYTNGSALNDMRLFSKCYGSRVRWEVDRGEDGLFELKAAALQQTFVAIGSERNREPGQRSGALAREQ